MLKFKHRECKNAVLKNGIAKICFKIFEAMINLIAS